MTLIPPTCDAYHPTRPRTVCRRPPHGADVAHHWVTYRIPKFDTFRMPEGLPGFPPLPLVAPPLDIGEITRVQPMTGPPEEPRP